MSKTKTMNVTPLGDRVLVKRVAADDKTKGGIILPDTAKEKPREGIVVAVGNGKLLDTGKRQEMSVKKNDRVLFSSYAGSEIKMDGDEMLILGEDEILAIIEN
jgi:chaperonin GroES